MWIFIGSYCVGKVSVRSSITVKTCFQCVQKLHHHPIYIIMVSDTLYNKHFILFLFISGWDLIDLIYFVSAAVVFTFSHSWIHSLSLREQFCWFLYVVGINNFTVRIYQTYQMAKRKKTTGDWNKMTKLCLKHTSSGKYKKSSYKHISRI